MANIEISRVNATIQGNETNFVLVAYNGSAILLPAFNGRGADLLAAAVRDAINSHCTTFAAVKT